MGREITLKKGTDCFIAVWNLHRSPDLWQGLTLVHFSAQPESFLTQNTL